MRRGSTEYGKLESLNVTRKVLSDIRMDSQVGNSSQGQFFWRLFNGFKNFEDADTAPLCPPLDALFFPGSVPLQKRVRYGTYCSYSMIAALEGH